MATPIKVSARDAERLDALARGRSLRAFAHDVLAVDLNPAQERWFSLLEPLDDGYTWRYKEIDHVAANQIGKTLGLAIVMVWACWNKIGVPTDDPEAWKRSAYPWYHVAPTLPQAIIPLGDILQLIQGEHPAQKKSGRKFLLPKGLITEKKLDVYYDGLEFWNGAQIQFRTTENKAKALQGRRAAGISADEVAFEDHLKSVVNETLMMRLVAMGGPLIMVSTPNGVNDWAEIVWAVQNESMDREPGTYPEHLVGGSCRPGERLPVWIAKDGTKALVWSTVADNIGFGIPPEEAARMERDLDPATKEQQLRGAFLEPAEAYFVPASFVMDAFKKGLPDDEGPQDGHSYIIGWDPSSASDPTVGIVLDVTENVWRGVHFRYYPKPIGDSKLLMEIYALHALYNSNGARAITAFDETSMGGAMLRQALSGLSPKKGVNFAGLSKKRELLTNLRAAINQRLIVFPADWTRLQRELLSYKLPDDKIVQDAVMATVVAAHVAAAGTLRATSVPFRPIARATMARHV